MVGLQSVRITENFSSRNLNIKYDRFTQVLYVKWSGELSVKRIRQELEIALGFARLHKVKKWLLDLSELKTLPEEHKWWVNFIFFPRLLGSCKGNCYVACILPVAFYSSVQDWFDSSKLIADDSVLLFNAFLVPEEGLRWLQPLA